MEESSGDFSGIIAIGRSGRRLAKLLHLEALARREYRYALERTLVEVTCN